MMMSSENCWWYCCWKCCVWCLKRFHNQRWNVCCLTLLHNLNLSVRYLTVLSSVFEERLFPNQVCYSAIIHVRGVVNGLYQLTMATPFLFAIAPNRVLQIITGSSPCAVCWTIYSCSDFTKSAKVGFSAFWRYSDITIYYGQKYGMVSITTG